MKRGQFSLREMLWELTWLALVFGAASALAIIPKQRDATRFLLSCFMAWSGAGAFGVLMGRMWTCLAFAAFYIAFAIFAHFI